MTDKRVVIVVRSEDQAAEIRQAGLDAIGVGAALLGYRWDFILVAIRPHEFHASEWTQAQRWLREDLPLKLRPGGRIEFI